VPRVDALLPQRLGHVRQREHEPPVAPAARAAAAGRAAAALALRPGRRARALLLRGGAALARPVAMVVVVVEGETGEGVAAFMA
jgi:hypothetical protein